MGPAMMAPPLFSMLLLAAGFCLLMMYCCMDWWHRKQLSYQALPQTAAKPEKEEDQPSRQYDVFSIDDSANETSDGKKLSPASCHPPWNLAHALLVLLPGVLQEGCAEGFSFHKFVNLSHL